jgi:hypothetical protein
VIFYTKTEVHMPNYTYSCLDCKKGFSIYMTYDAYDHQKVTCVFCKSPNVQRRIGLIRIAQSEENRLEKFTDPNTLSGLEDDPRALGKMMRQMSSEVGEDMGTEFDEVIDRLESGQSPEDIEQSMPELGVDSDAPGGFTDDF